jgi:hypothetical protein
MQVRHTGLIAKPTFSITSREVSPKQRARWRGHTGEELGTRRESVEAPTPAREKRFEAKLQRQARQRGYQLVPIEKKPAA